MPTPTRSHASPSKKSPPRRQSLSRRATRRRHTNKYVSTSATIKDIELLRALRLPELEERYGSRFQYGLAPHFHGIVHPARNRYWAGAGFNLLDKNNSPEGIKRAMASLGRSKTLLLNGVPFIWRPTGGRKIEPDGSVYIFASLLPVNKRTLTPSRRQLARRMGTRRRVTVK